jgi:hypothetical protein
VQAKPSASCVVQTLRNGQGTGIGEDLPVRSAAKLTPNRLKSMRLWPAGDQKSAKQTRLLSAAIPFGAISSHSIHPQFLIRNEASAVMLQAEKPAELVLARIGAGNSLGTMIGCVVIVLAFGYIHDFAFWVSWA